MTAPKPLNAREPYCIHSNPRWPQPASACIECSEGPALRKWQEDWAAWLAEHPDSPEARWLAEMDRHKE